MSTGLRKFSVKNFFLLKNPQKVVLNPFQQKNFLPNKNFFGKNLENFGSTHPSPLGVTLEKSPSTTNLVVKPLKKLF